MRRLLIALMLTLILMMTVGTSMTLADAPDCIYIDPNAELKSDVVTFSKDDVNDGKPEVWMKKDGAWTLVNSKMY